MNYRRKSAYYSANFGNEYSRSARAQEAEDNGRLPRTRAAAALGISVKAFDAGCAAANYRSTEWHHVGKYANMVDYFDTNTLADSAEFWKGAASAYRSKRKQTELLAEFQKRWDAQKADRIEEFRQKLIEQRDCSVRLPHREPGTYRWGKFCQARGAMVGCSCSIVHETIPCGDFAALAAQITQEQELTEHNNFRKTRDALNYSAETVYRDSLAAWKLEQSAEILSIVPPLAPNGQPWVGQHKFVSRETVTVIATATKKYFRNKMIEARLVAVELGFNAVMPANPTGHMYGNGWIPCIAQ